VAGGRASYNRILLWVISAAVVLAAAAAYYRFALVSGRSGPAAATARPAADTPPLLRLSGSNTIGAQLGPEKIAVMSPGAPPAGAPSAYAALLPRADRLSVDLRFRPNSRVLDPNGVDDIKRIASVMSTQFSDRGIMLIGFADSNRTREYNLLLSRRRAQSVGEEMRQEGINPVLVAGFGEELPVADNGTREGQEKNRRVEVWLRK